MGRARAPGGGRRPTPTILKKLNGNPGRRRLNAKEPRPDPSIPECPTVLQGPARAEWDRMSALLHGQGLLTVLDGAALTAYCLAWERLVEAQEKLRAHGTVILSPNAFPMQSPYLSIVTKATEQMMRILVEFGMTPSSRTRVRGTSELANLSSLGAEDSEEDPAVRWEREFGGG